MFASETSTRPEREYNARSWADIVSAVVGERPRIGPNKEDLPFFIPGTLKEAELRGVTLQRAVARGEASVGKQRSNAHIDQLYFVAADLDELKQPQVEGILQRMRDAGLAFAAYSTHSFGLKSGHRTRVLLPFDQPVSSSGFRSIAARVNEIVFDGAADKACERPAQLAGVWAAHPDRVQLAFKEVHSVGHPISVVALVSSSPSAQVLPYLGMVRNANADLTASEALPDSARIEEALRWLDPNDYAAWSRLAPLLKAWGLSTDEAVAKKLWLDFSGRAGATAKVNNHLPQYDPERIWDECRPDAPAAPAAGSILADALRVALAIAKLDAGERQWSTRGSAAASYLAKHHPKHLPALEQAGCPGFSTDEMPAKGTAPSAEQAAGAFDVFFDQYGTANVLLQRGERIECLPWGGESSQDAILLQASTLGQKLPSKEGLDRAIRLHRAVARQERRRRSVFVRIGRGEADYLLDLGDAQGWMARIAEGSWTLEKNTRIAWSRQDGYASLPRPTVHPHPDAAWEALAPLWEVTAIPEQMQLPLIAALVEWLRPDTPHPILEFSGAAGSGKSTAAQFVARLIDPTEYNVPPVVTPEEEHMCALAQSRHVLFMDNLSRLGRDGQDLLCRCATGTVIGVRRFYGHTEADMLPLHRPVLLTGISPVITAPDLLDRALRVPMLGLAGHLPGPELNKRFLNAWPDMLGAILTLFAQVRGQLSRIVRQQAEWRVRLVEFAQTGEALAQILGRRPGEFLASLSELRNRQARDIAEGDIVARLLVEVLRNLQGTAPYAPELPYVRQWSKGSGGSHSAVRRPDGGLLVGAQVSWLRSQVRLRALQEASALSGRSNVPESDRAMGVALTRLQPLLRDLGIRAERCSLDGPKVSGWKFLLAPEVLAVADA